MPEPSGKHLRTLDAFLGKMALDRGFISPDQLREALADQAADVEAGRPQSRSVGDLLVAKGYLTVHQLKALLAEQGSAATAPAADPGPLRRQDAMLGRVLVERGVATAEQVHECLRIQATTIEQGAADVPRLGELLVRKGYAAAEAVGMALAQQEKTILACPDCGRRYNVKAFNPHRTYRCRSCPEAHLAPLADLDHVRVDETSSGLRPAAAAPEFPPLGKYAILRVLGRGAMGVVYEAFDTALKRKVALKMMLGNPQPDPKEAAQEDERFVREGQLCAKIPKHPNIVAVYEAGIIEGKRYIAMEFIAGLPMSKWRKTGSVTLRQQVRLLRDVASAVHTAHAGGIIHRDLKPENVLVDEKGHPFVTDFGLAKRLGQSAGLSLTVSGLVVGTPSYMSPEQAQGLKTIDSRTDVWSLGVMLYEIVTGKLPFTGETAVEVMMKTVKNAVPAPSSVAGPGVNPSLDAGIENICLKALAKPPKDRYATAQAFADDLTTWLQGEKVRTVAPAARSILRARPSYEWAWIGGAAFAAVLLAIVYLPASGPAGAPVTPPRAAADLAAGDQAMKVGDWKTALESYTAAATRNPGNTAAKAGCVAAQARIDKAASEARAADATAGAEAARRQAEERLKAEQERLARESAAEAARAKAEADARLKEAQAKFEADRMAAEERARKAEAAAKSAGELAKAEAERRETERAAEAAKAAAESEARRAAEQRAAAEAARKAPAADAAVKSPAKKPDPGPAAAPLPAPAPATGGPEEELLAQAEEAVAKKQYAAAQRSLERILKKYPGTPAAARAAELQVALPSPEGRLLLGFDAAPEAKPSVVKADVVCVWDSDTTRVREGAGAVHLTIRAKSTGGGGRDEGGEFIPGMVQFAVPEQNLERMKAVSFWAWFDPNAGQSGKTKFCLFSPGAGDLQNYFEADFTLMGAPGWRPVRLTTDLFKKKGAADIRRITAVGFISHTGELRDFTADSIRVRE